MLPGLGPSTLRDTLSKPVSSFLSVTFHMTETDVNITLKSIDAIETRERLLDVESLLLEINMYLLKMHISNQYSMKLKTA